jgi:hypothetical protein
MIPGFKQDRFRRKISMGAFNAEPVMYNHFGYRSPIAKLYNWAPPAIPAAPSPAARPTLRPASSRAISD